MKLPLFADDRIVYMENSIASNKKVLHLINEFGKKQDAKSIIRNGRHFCTPKIKYH